MRDLVNKVITQYGINLPAVSYFLEKKQINVTQLGIPVGMKIIRSPSSGSSGTFAGQVTSDQVIEQWNTYMFPLTVPSPFCVFHWTQKTEDWDAEATINTRETIWAHTSPQWEWKENSNVCYIILLKKDSAMSFGTTRYDRAILDKPSTTVAIPPSTFIVKGKFVHNEDHYILVYQEATRENELKIEDMNNKQLKMVNLGLVLSQIQLVEEKKNLVSKCFQEFPEHKHLRDFNLLKEHELLSCVPPEHITNYLIGRNNTQEVLESFLSNNVLVPLDVWGYHVPVLEEIKKKAPSIIANIANRYEFPSVEQSSIVRDRQLQALWTMRDPTREEFIGLDKKYKGTVGIQNFDWLEQNEDLFKEVPVNIVEAMIDDLIRAEMHQKVQRTITVFSEVHTAFIDISYHMAIEHPAWFIDHTDFALTEIMKEYLDEDVLHILNQGISLKLKENVKKSKMQHHDDSE